MTLTFILMRIKPLIFTFCCFLLMQLAPVGAQTQSPQHARQEMELQRVAFLTTRMELTPAEATVFWPLYNEYNQKRNELMNAQRSIKFDPANLNTMSNAELEEWADFDIRSAEQMAALRRHYHEEFKKVLPLKKVILLYQAEREFHRRLFDESRQRARDGRGRQQQR